MDILTAKTELIRRTLDWSTRDFAREIAADFPILTTYGLNNRYVLGYVHWFQTLDQATLEALKDFLPRWALRLTVPDEDKWRQMTIAGSNRAFYKLPPLATANQNAPDFVPIDKHLMLDFLDEKLSPIFGKPKSKKGLTLKYVNRYGDWQILTNVSLGSRWGSELRHEHTIKRKDYSKTGRSALSDLHPFWRKTLAGFWGISNSEWLGIPSQQDMKPVAKSLVTICEHFMKGFPPLLIGLNCND